MKWLVTLLVASALGCGARTALDEPSSDAPSSDSPPDDGGPREDDGGPRGDDGGPRETDAGRPGDGGTFVPSAPTRLAAGTRHTCAVVEGGLVRCWGHDDDGQLGVPPDGRDDLYPPTLVPGIADAVEVTAGSETSCARHESGAVSCWGRLDPDGPVVEPTRVLGITAAVELTSGNFHNCARLRDSSVVCWGANARGQLGDGTTTRRDTPTPVVGLARAEEISAGWDHSCARSGGAVFCWGHNADGQLGDGTFDPQLRPTRIAAELGAVEIAAGWSHTCARTRAGHVFCWGRRWGDGALPGVEPLHNLSPTRVEGAEDVVEIDAGGAHTCTRDTEGRIECWGRNGDGQLGDGTASRASDRTEPRPVTALTRTDELVAGWVHNCARERSGRVLCWGNLYPRRGWRREGELVVVPRPVEGF